MGFTWEPDLSKQQTVCLVSLYTGLIVGSVKRSCHRGKGGWYAHAIGIAALWCPTKKLAKDWVMAQLIEHELAE